MFNFGKGRIKVKGTNNWVDIGSVEAISITMSDGSIQRCGTPEAIFDLETTPQDRELLAKMHIMV